MKKVLSILLTFCLIIPTMIFATVSASDTASDSSIYTTVDISSQLTNKLYANQSDIASITDPKAPDYFLPISNPNNYTLESYAVDLDDMNSKLTDGIFTYNGVPFKVDTTKGGVLRDDFSFTSGYYSEVKILAISGPKSYGNNEYYSSVYSGSSTVAVTKSGVYPTGIGTTVKVRKIATDTESQTESNATLNVYTLKVNDKTQKINKVGIWALDENNYRILAVTTVGFKGSDWNDLIAKKLESFSTDDVKNYDKTAYSEIDELITRAKNEGSDVSAIDGIEKYNKVKTYLKTVSEAYTQLEMKGHYNSEIYLSADKVGKVETATYPNYFIPTGNNSGDEKYPKKPYAISKETMEAKLTDGIYTSKTGTPYKIVDSDGKMASLNATSDGSFAFNDYCSEVRVLVACGSRYKYGDNELYRDFYYTYNTDKATSNFSEVLDDTMSAVKVTDVDVSDEKVDLYEYTYKIADKTKKITKIVFYSKDSSSKRILGITTVGLVGDDYVPFITEKLSVLPDKFADLDITSFNELADMIEKAKAGGADVSEIDGIDKYNAFKEIIDGSYTTMKFTGNAIGFLSKEKAGTYTEETGANLNFFGSWNQPTTLAISKESFEKLPHDENGVYTFNGTPYKINTADGEKTVAQSGGSTIGQKRYSQIKVIAAFPDVSSWDKKPDHALYFYVKYSDGNENGYTMNCNDGTVVAKDIDWVAVKSTDTAPTYKAQIREYTIPVDTTKNVSGYTIWYPENGIALTPGRVIAFTTVDAISDNWTKDTNDILLENVTLRNSSRTAVDNVYDITDGKLTFTADVSNYKHKEGKALNIITAVYNDGVLYDVKITPVKIAYNTMYGLNVTMDIPTEGLNEKWTTSTFVWDSDVVTPLTANVVK